MLKDFVLAFSRNVCKFDWSRSLLTVKMLKGACHLTPPYESVGEGLRQWLVVTFVRVWLVNFSNFN